MDGTFSNPLKATEVRLESIETSFRAVDSLGVPGYTLGHGTQVVD